MALVRRTRGSMDHDKLHRDYSRHFAPGIWHRIFPRLLGISADVDRDHDRVGPGDDAYLHAAGAVRQFRGTDPLLLSAGRQRRRVAGPFSHRTGDRAFSRALRPLLFADSRSEEHTSELQSIMRTSYAAFRLKKKKYDN